MDAENYSNYPEGQFEEDNVLRELNKCLLAFRQNSTCQILPKNPPQKSTMNRRLNSLSSVDSLATDSESISKERNNVVQRR